MARITWQNVTAPDLSTSRAALQQAGNSFNRGFEGFADTFRDIEQQQKDAYSQEALARLAQVTDPNQMNQMMASGGLASLGITDPRYLNADAMQSILGRPKTLFDNQNTAMNTANVQSQLNERNTLLPGKVRKQGADLAFTQAQTGLTYAQTDESRQNIANTKSIITARNERLKADQELWSDQNRDRDRKSDAEIAIEKANDFSLPFIQAAKKLNDPVLLKKWMDENQETIYADPKLVNEELNDIFDKGPMYAEPDFTAEQNFNLNQADIGLKTQARDYAEQILNSPQATSKEQALALLNSIPAFQDNPKLYEAVATEISGRSEANYLYPEALSNAVRNTTVNTQFDQLYSNVEDILSWDTNSATSAFITGTDFAELSKQNITGRSIIDNLTGDQRPADIDNDAWRNGRGKLIERTNQLLADYKDKVPPAVIAEIIQKNLAGRSNLYLALVDWNDTDSLIVNYDKANKELARLADPKQRNQMMRVRGDLASRQAELKRIGNDRAMLLAQKERAVAKKAPTQTIALYDRRLQALNARLEEILKSKTPKESPQSEQLTSTTQSNSEEIPLDLRPGAIPFNIPPFN